MNRLTQYYEVEDRYLASEGLKEESKNQCLGLGNSVGNSFEKVFNKLGKLEDIEEELGCPIVVLFRALRDGIYAYCKLYTGVKEEVVFGKYIPDLCGMELVFEDEYPYNNDELFKVPPTSNSFKLCDYKKTWWLKEDKSE